MRARLLLVIGLLAISAVRVAAGDGAPVAAQNQSTPVCTPPLCRGDEVFACPSTCPGGCGTICATRSPTPVATQPCAGDCSGDGRVDIGELVRGVRVLLGAGDDVPCTTAFDREGSGMIAIDDLIAAVRNALGGCAQPPDAQYAACRDSGGIAERHNCCDGVGDFRDTCHPGSCGDCPFDARHLVRSCQCGTYRCFDGALCVPQATPTPTPTLDPSVPTPTPTHNDAVLTCLRSGGTDSSRSCCLGVGIFPSTCDVDVCACPPEFSHAVRACECGPGRCFDWRRGGCVSAAE
jgi:hypothetical protein